MYRFNFYPTLLDKFQRYLDSDKAFEDFSNKDKEGNYKFSQEEIERERFQSLLDTINRKPFSSVAADKGTAFNATIDFLATFTQSEGVSLADDGKSIVAKTNGNSFIFPKELVEPHANDYKDAIPQLRVEAELPTAYGIVNLYGYIDELVKDKVVDLKTTTRYSFGKFEQSWQRRVYPYCLVKSGMMERVRAFEFDVYVWTSNGFNNYKEYYVNDHQKNVEDLTKMCSRFIEFLLDNRKLITDSKIIQQL